MKILLVDDSPTQLQKMASTLTDTHEVVLALTIAEAIPCLACDDIDMVFTDYHMPPVLFSDVMRFSHLAASSRWEIVSATPAPPLVIDKREIPKIVSNYAAGNGTKTSIISIAAELAASLDSCLNFMDGEERGKVGQ